MKGGDNMKKLLKNLRKNGSTAAPKEKKIKDARCGSQGNCQRC